jgi:hypothetical protein
MLETLGLSKKNIEKSSEEFGIGILSAALSNPGSCKRKFEPKENNTSAGYL